MREPVSLGDFIDYVKKHEFFIHPFPELCYKNIRVIRLGVELSREYCLTQFRPRVTGHKLWFFKPEHPSKHAASHVYGVTYGMSSKSDA